jgi:hypothetical protein
MLFLFTQHNRLQWAAGYMDFKKKNNSAVAEVLFPIQKSPGQIKYDNYTTDFDCCLKTYVTTIIQITNIEP